MITQEKLAPVAITEDFSTYLKNAENYITSHQLITFKKCPKVLALQRDGLYPEVKSTALTIGRAFHSMLFDNSGDFYQNYAIGGPVNPKTGKCFGVKTQTYQEWAVKQKREVLTDEQMQILRQMEAEVCKTKVAIELLSNGLAEFVLRQKYCQIDCQSRPDYYNFQHGLVELKTVDDIENFLSDVRKYHYLNQLAFYRSMLEIATGVPEREIPAQFIVVEKKMPYRVAVWKVKSELLNEVAKENVKLLEQLKVCQADNYWPTRYEDSKTLSRFYPYTYLEEEESA